MKDDVWMQLALEQASCAYRANEVPVGALIVHDNAVLSADHNRMREHHDPTAHAEMLVMKEAYARIGTLKGCTMYVTLEPCAMCAGAIVHSRIVRVVIGAEDIKYGACGSVFDVCGSARMNHVPEIGFGMLREKSSSMLREFFQGKRALKKEG